MRKAIALLITVMFVMVISVAIGYGLTQLKDASSSVVLEQKLYQDTMILDDVLEILRTSPELLHLADNNASDDLYLFLQNSQYLPLEHSKEKIVITFKSARSHININTLNKANEELFRNYFSRRMVGNTYIDVLKECMRINQEKEGYNDAYKSALFEKYPELFRDYIASKEHLDMINTFYMNEYGDTSLKNVPFSELFSYSDNPAEVIDLNYATVEVWSLLLDVAADRATVLTQNAGRYKSWKDVGLTPSEQKNIAKFKTTFFAPYLDVEIKVGEGTQRSKIYFTYDIKQKRGYDFVFKL